MPQKCYLVIGNGFDLAHGAPTSFIDFSNWLLNDYIRRFFKIIKNNEANDFLSQEIINKVGSGKYQKKQHLHTNDSFHPYFSALQNDDFATVTNLLNDKPYLFQRFFSDMFIKNLYTDRKSHWFAIESEFYNTLCKHSKNKVGENRKKAITQLNSQMVFLKNKLREYLKTIEFDKNIGIDKFMRKAFSQYSEITIINFNYTNSVDLYLPLGMPGAKIKKINIHGTIKEGNEIFGYGNDLNQEYKRLKDLEEDYILENFKTVNYMMDNKYSNFINDIHNRNAFDVFVIGHSLGLTDKTLLQEIFDHQNCFRIKLLKRLDFNQNETRQMQVFKTLIMSIT